MEKLNLVVVFIEGLVSFLSPCVLPILPVYLAMLSQNTDNEGQAKRNRKTLLINTLLFVLGISTTFLILGTGVGFIRPFLMSNKNVFLGLGGLLIIGMGLFYMDLLKIDELQREKRMHYQVKKMNPLAAYILGFTFSFGWTPCIGPMLASVLVVASTSSNALTGYLLIGVYTLGFVVPFLLLAVFAEKMIELLERVKSKGLSIKRIGGMLLVLTGLVFLMNGLTGPKEVITKPTNEKVQEQSSSKEEQSNEEAEVDEEAVLAPDFILEDQYGNTHKLSDYQGKTVFLNFWATWCPPCKKEMPDIEKLYEEYGLNEDEVIVLGVAMPNIGREGSKEDIIEFLDDEGYTFPVVFDESAELMYNYQITAFPTTFIINPKGEVALYVPGAMDLSTMKELVEKY